MITDPRQFIAVLCVVLIICSGQALGQAPSPMPPPTVSQREALNRLRQKAGLPPLAPQGEAAKPTEAALTSPATIQSAPSLPAATQVAPAQTAGESDRPAQAVAQQQPAKPGMPSGATNTGGYTASGRHYDYKKVDADKITYFHVLKTREEIDEYIARQYKANPLDQYWKKLYELPWTVMQHEWRRDPVTSSPIAQLPPTQTQFAELEKAIHSRLDLNPEAKAEFIQKIGIANCKVANELDPPRFVVMINRTGENEKLEVSPGLAGMTKTCEFFIENQPVVLNLVFICGNFGYVFVDVWYEANPGTPEIKTPESCQCAISPPEAVLSKPGDVAIFSMSVNPPIKNLDEATIEWFRQTNTGSVPLTRGTLRAEVPGSFLDSTDTWIPIQGRATVGLCTATCDARVMLKSPDLPPSVYVPKPEPPKRDPYCEVVVSPPVVRYPGDQFSVKFTDHNPDGVAFVGENTVRFHDRNFPGGYRIPQTLSFTQERSVMGNYEGTATFTRTLYKNADKKEKIIQCSSPVSFQLDRDKPKRNFCGPGYVFCWGPAAGLLGYLATRGGDDPTKPGIATPHNGIVP